MIVVCPACHSRYHVDRDMLNDGRHVRCVSCGHSWLQAGLPPAEPNPNPFYTPSYEPPYDGRSSKPKGPTRHSFPADPIKKNLRLLAWGFGLGLLILAGSFAWQSGAWTPQVVSHISRLWSLLKADKQSPQDVFKISHLRTDVVTAHPPSRDIRITGSITNISDQVHPLAPLQIHLWGTTAASETAPSSQTPPTTPPALLETRPYILPQSHLLPGETIDFDVPLHINYPTLAAASVTF